VHRCHGHRTSPTVEHHYRGHRSSSMVEHRYLGRRKSRTVEHRYLGRRSSSTVESRYLGHHKWPMAAHHFHGLTLSHWRLRSQPRSAVKGSARRCAAIFPKLVLASGIRLES